MAKPKSRRSAEEKFSKPTFTPTLADSDLEKIEGDAMIHGVARRIAMATLTRSAEQLLSGLDEETANALMDGFDRIERYRKWREMEGELLEAAQARILHVLGYKFPEREAA